MTLDQVVPWGRSFGEYRRMFALSDAALSGRVLGCGDGPASFNAEATARGHRVVSCDPVYQVTAAEIGRRVDETHATVVGQLEADPSGYVWAEFRDPAHLGECRLAAMRRFLADYDAGRAAGRYVPGSLPVLPFPDGAFDLAVVSHLLFLYSDHLDAAFHRAAIGELLRVAAEVRVFPLLTLRGERSPHLDAVRGAAASAGAKAEVARVDYEFQRGGNEMLRLVRPGGPTTRPASPTPRG